MYIVSRHTPTNRLSKITHSPLALLLKSNFLVIKPGNEIKGIDMQENRISFDFNDNINISN